MKWGLRASVAGLLLMSPASPAADDLDPFLHLSGSASSWEAKQPRFSTTQHWAPFPSSFLKKAPLMLPKDWETTIVLPDPPHNRSARTQAEIEYLAGLQGKRTPADEALILSEADGNDWRFGEHRFVDLLGGDKRPKTRDLVIAAVEDFSPVIFKMKKKYDRVRPSFLDPRLKPAMKVPDHPAYPSGHASQALFMAYLLAELDPPNCDVYLADAIAIAKRRELAGVHYPSDTAAGGLLARQMLDVLLAQKQFRGLLEKARAEWEPKRPSI
jgi:hypothetical protein